MICKQCAAEADAQTLAVDHVIELRTIGHKVCKGCTCQHKPVKDGQIVREAQQD